MRFNKIVSLLTAILLTTSFLAGCMGKDKYSSDDKGDKSTLRIGMITDTGGINDQSFNQSAWEGLLRAKKDLSVEVTYLESKQESDYSSNLEVFVDEELPKDLKNVKSILFSSEQASYLVGLISRKMTKNNHIGFIGGMDIPVINTFKYDYMAGVKQANPNIEDYVNKEADKLKNGEIKAPKNKQEYDQMIK